MTNSLADELTNYDAFALAEQIRSGQLSAVEVVGAHFERIENLNQKYNALVTLDKAGALQRAREADSDLADHKSWGPLHGVPVTIKDALNTAGLRTTAGYHEYSNHVPEKDSWVVDRLKRAGAIVIGKTNCATLCLDVQTTNDIFGTTNNPWDVGRTSGGSSGGEAVAVALGMSSLGIGSDTAGSIRIPSSYCGVYGLRTSPGKIPRDGLLPTRSAAHDRQDSLTVIGPIARSMRDISLCYEVLTGETIPQDCNAQPRVFWTHESPEQMIDDDVLQVLGAVYADLVEGGANIVKVQSPVAFKELLTMGTRLSMFEFWPEQAGKLTLRMFSLFESLRSLFSGGVAGSYAKLKQQQSQMSSKVAHFMEDCDCWVLPATPSVAFSHRRVGKPIPLTLAGRVKKCSYWLGSMGFTCPISLLGNPSLVVPVGRSRDGMPVAVQIVGRRGEDATLLNVAAKLAHRIETVRRTANE